MHPDQPQTDRRCHPDNDADHLLQNASLHHDPPVNYQKDARAGQVVADQASTPAEAVSLEATAYRFRMVNRSNARVHRPGVFDEATAQRVRSIRMLLDAGLSCDEIRQLGDFLGRDHGTSPRHSGSVPVAIGKHGPREVVAVAGTGGAQVVGFSDRDRQFVVADLGFDVPGMFATLGGGCRFLPQLIIFPSSSCWVRGS